MSYFEEEVDGKLRSSGQSPTSSFRSESFTQKIHAIRSALVEEEEDTSQLLIDKSTPQKSRVKAKLLEDPRDNDSETSLNFNTIEVNEPSDIIGTNSKISSNYQMSDPNLRWIKDLITKKDKKNGRLPKLNKKDL